MSSQIRKENEWQRVVPGMQQELRGYVSLLQELGGSNLAAVTALGSVVDGPFEGPDAFAATVIVLNKVDLMMLKRLGEQGRRLSRSRIAAPMVMTSSFIEASLDSFPLELLEIQQKHVTLIGPDFFDGLVFQPEHVRLQCERELKRIQLRLRQGLLASGGKDSFLSHLEADVGEHLMRTIRGLLWLEGKHGYMGKSAALAACESMSGRSLPGIRQAVGGRPCGEWSEFVALYEDAEALAAGAK